MAKDDYFVIVYQILSYLYVQLKKGQSIMPEMLFNDGPLMKINYNYWVYIIVNMVDQGFIRGISNPRSGNGYYIKDQLPNVEITPKGIDYLCDNSFIEKTKQYLKDIKDIVPFM